MRFDAEPDGIGSMGCGNIRPDWFVDFPLCYRVIFYHHFAYIIFLILILIIYTIWANFQKTLHFEKLIFFLEEVSLFPIFLIISLIENQK